MDASDTTAMGKVVDLAEQLFRLGYDFRQPMPEDHADHAAYPTVVDLLFKPEMPNGSGAWIVGIGPYFGYGLSGKTSGTAGNTTFSGDPFKDNGSGASLKRFDAGANVQLGYEMSNGFNIGLNAEWGLVNILNNAGSGGSGSSNSARNTSFAVMVGYTLGKR